MSANATWHITLMCLRPIAGLSVLVQGLDRPNASSIYGYQVNVGDRILVEDIRAAFPCQAHTGVQPRLMVIKTEANVAQKLLEVVLKSYHR